MAQEEDLSKAVKQHLHAPLNPPSLESMQDAVDIVLAVAVNKLGTHLPDAEPELAVKITGALVSIGRLLEWRRQSAIDGTIEIDLDDEHDLSTGV